LFKKPGQSRKGVIFILMFGRIKKIAILYCIKTGSMKKSIILFLLFTYHFTIAQVPDSLYKQLIRAKEDTNKAKILNAISRVYINSKPDSALYYLDIQKKLCEKLHYVPYLINYYINASSAYNNLEKYDTSMLLNQQCLAVALQYGNTLKIGYSLANLAGSFTKLSQYDSAAFYYLKAITYLDKEIEKDNVIYMYGNLAALYKNLEQYDRAISYLRQGLNLHYNGFGSNEAYAFTLTNLSGVFQDLNKFDSSIYYADKAIEVCKRNDIYRNQMVCFQNKFTSTMYLGQYNKLDAIIREMELLGPFLKNPSTDIKIALNKGFLNYYKGQYNVANEYAIQSLELSSANENLDYIIKSYQLLSKIATGLGNYKLADIYDFKIDSIHQIQVTDKLRGEVQNLEKKFETQKKSIEILKLKNQNEKKSTQNKFLLTTAIGLILFSLLAYRNFTNKQKLQQAKITELEKDKQLLTVDAMLKGQETERSRIAKDLHDGLGGMLSGTKLSFINMKENLVLTPENALLFEKSLTMLDNSIVDLRKVAQNLMPEALVKFGLNEATRDFCDSIKGSSGVNIVYQHLGEQRKLEATSEVFTYRILQELVNNAVKHAGASQIFVQLTMDTNKLSITVEDDGKGFSMNDAANSKGAGLSNITYRVQYLNGTIDIVTTPGNGTSVNVELKA
jgi:two-component system, NarL family, sensor kinase